MSPLLVSILIYVTFLCMFLPGRATGSCSPGSFSPGDSIACKPCPAGRYCPYTNPNAPSYGTSQVSCPRGTYVSYTGAASVDECLKCAVGTYSGLGYAECWSCPHGTYCDTKGTDSPKKCPPGTYQPNTGATSSKACVTCPTGTLNLLSGGSACYPCPNGCSCPNPAQMPVPLSNSSKCMDDSSNNHSSTQSPTLPSLTLPGFSFPSLTGFFTTTSATTKIPSTTTKIPTVTTKSSSTTTKTPTVTTKNPSTTTKTPAVTTKIQSTMIKTSGASTQTLATATKTPSKSSSIRSIRIASASNSSKPFPSNLTSPPITVFNSVSSIRCSSTVIQSILLSLLVCFIAVFIDH